METDQKLQRPTLSLPQQPVSEDGLSVFSKPVPTRPQGEGHSAGPRRISQGSITSQSVSTTASSVSPQSTDAPSRDSKAQKGGVLPSPAGTPSLRRPSVVVASPSPSARNTRSATGRAMSSHSTFSQASPRGGISPAEKSRLPTPTRKTLTGGAGRPALGVGSAGNGARDGAGNGGADTASGAGSSAPPRQLRPRSQVPKPTPPRKATAGASDGGKGVALASEGQVEEARGDDSSGPVKPWKAARQRPGRRISAPET